MRTGLQRTIAGLVAVVAGSVAALVRLLRKRVGARGAGARGALVLIGRIAGERVVVAAEVRGRAALPLRAPHRLRLLLRRHEGRRGRPAHERDPHQPSPAVDTTLQV